MTSLSAHRSPNLCARRRASRQGRLTASQRSPPFESPKPPGVGEPPYQRYLEPCRLWDVGHQYMYMWKTYVWSGEAEGVAEAVPDCPCAVGVAARGRGHAHGRGPCARVGGGIVYV